jgi:CheY-like chemotaxis protein
MDLQMPVMDGITSTKEIRRRGYAMPIIAVTANALPEERKRCFGSGMNGLVTKPLDVELLFVMMARWIVPRTVIDKKSALAVMGKNESLYHKLTHEFLEKHRRLTLEFPFEDAKQARLAAHSISGAAAYLGMPKVQQRAKTLESDCLNGAGRPRLEASVLALQQALDEVRSAYVCRRTKPLVEENDGQNLKTEDLSTNEHSETEPEGSFEGRDSAQDESALKRLVDYLRAGDVRAEEALRNVMATLPGEPDPVWWEVQARVDDLNLEGALEIIRSHSIFEHFFDE